MFYLKVVLLISYFLIIFLFFRVSSTLSNGNVADVCQSIRSFLEDIISSSNDDNKEATNRSTWKHRVETINDTEESFCLGDEDIQETDLQNYQDFIEKVEDTKASVWVVKINPPTTTQTQAEEINDEPIKWHMLSRKLRHNGIRTSRFNCLKDIRLCLIHKVTTPTILLTMPKGSQPKGKVVFHLYQPEKTALPPFEWIQQKLYPKVKTVHSMSELIEPPVTRLIAKKRDLFPSMYFVYRSKTVQKPPLLITALSVRFTGRIKFYMLKANEKEDDNIFAINQFLQYSYGSHQGENFTYSCMELFLRTVHPEVNDIFIASLILLNMACWFEVSLQKGGPLRRLLFYIWGFATSNFLLVTIWLPLLKLIYMPQAQPLVEVCLQNLQKMMFTNIAAIVRQDFMTLSNHLHIVVFGFMCYGIFLGYLHFRFRGGSWNEWTSSTSISDIFQHDIEDIRNSFHTLLANITPTLRIYRFEASIERILLSLSTSEIWLPTEVYTDYIKDLPIWKYCAYHSIMPVETVTSDSFTGDDESNISSHSSTEAEECSKGCPLPAIPDHIFKVHNCVICLEDYKCQNKILGLPCGHSFHQKCAKDWLSLEGARNRCPVCRWPCNIKKGSKIEVIDTIE